MKSPPATTTAILADLQALADPERGRFLQRFFKTQPEGYGAGDKFLGLRVPQLRKLSRRYKHTDIKIVVELLLSEWHEARQLALFIWVLQYARGDEQTRTQIFTTYLAHRQQVNNWDLVDGSAPQIIGTHLLYRDRKLLYELLAAGLWERRIAILATLAFIRVGDFNDTLHIAELCLNDKRDLIHKASGWMLREVGKRDVEILREFLRRFCSAMPRTMLRYSIERFEKSERVYWLNDGRE